MNLLQALVRVGVEEAEERLPEPEAERVLNVPAAADSFPEQWCYVQSENKLNAVCCSRRAGKTQGEILRKVCILAKPGTYSHYVSLIRRNAKKQFFTPLLRMLDELGWVRGRDYRANETEMIITTAWGSFLQALSCDDIAGVKAVKGDRSDDFTIDECQEPNDDVIRALVEVAAEPMLTDTDGALNLLGTPPEAEPCFFSEALDSDGWAHFHWTQFDHDYPRPREKKWETVKKRCGRRHLKLDVQEAVNDNGKLVLVLGPGTHPTVAREYFGKRVKDPSKLAYEYMPGRNDYDPADVDFTNGHDREWRHAGGLDIGFQDNDAIVIGAYNRKDPERKLYARWQWLHNHLDYEDTKDVVTIVQRVFGSMSWVADYHGGGSLKIVESLRTRLRLMLGLKPPDVMISVGLVNDDYRTGRFLIHTEQVEITKKLLEEVGHTDWDDRRKERVRTMIESGAAQANIAKDAGKVTKTVNPRTRKVEINKKGFHSDLTECGRYMHHAAFHFLAKKPKPEPTPEEKRTMRILAKAAARKNPFGRRLSVR